ncbi:uncharacterized protein [Solanum tuberosum]|uniref:uncharacterized protein n=1 Tax=Solanum tuberosum TaxID=4113 RepID=UPI00073A0757|nr:PREDICTED: uncharacterized protein LOC107058415 [Solanum tuberosum]
MDKSWTHIGNGALSQYLNGVEQFLNFAFFIPEVGVRIQCPCIKCNNVLWKTQDEVKADLCRWGMNQTYKKWIHHGELDLSLDDETNINEDSNLENDDAPIFEILHDIYHGVSNNSHDFVETTELGHEEPNIEAKNFYRLMKDVEIRLYPNCEKFSKLSFIVRLFQMKCMHGWSITSFDSLLKLLSDALPKENVLPNSLYEVQKIIKDLGLDYVKIDACVNNCILYRQEYADLEQCPKCGEKRWTMRKGENANNEVASDNLNKKKKGIPRKILRYVLLIPRLQRLFMTKGTAKEMRWHKDNQVDDVLQHPADLLTWKFFDEKHPNFPSDPRSVRLGLALDGFNPFGSMSNSYSMWPVILIPYNLSPWVCMKQSNILLSLLIPGPKGPGMNIYVYLQPLIDDLKTLWGDVIESYDAFMKQNFQLRASLLWTVNDFSAYGILFDWSTIGKLACPVCHVHTFSIYLKHGRKQCYMGHRRLLEINHPYRRNKSSFDITKEERLAPQALSGEDVLVQLNTSSQRSVDDNTRKRKRDTVAQMEKRNLEMHISKLSSQGLKKNIPKELVLEKIQEEVKARAMLRTAEETKRKLLSEKSSLEKKIIELEKRKSSEFLVLRNVFVNTCLILRLLEPFFIPANSFKFRLLFQFSIQNVINGFHIVEVDVIMLSRGGWGEGQKIYVMDWWHCFLNGLRFMVHLDHINN